jgi:hypothetical protein
MFYVRLYVIFFINYIKLIAEIVAVCRNYNILKTLVLMGPYRIKMIRSKTLINITTIVDRSVS